MADFIQNGGINGGSYASHFSGILSVWENSYDVGNNTSNIGYRLQLKSGSSGRFSDLTASYSVTINGTTVKSGNGRYSSQSYNTTQTICEGTMTIAHNDDGSKAISCSAVLDFQTNSYSPGDFTPRGTLTLTTIPRASSISCTTANIEEVATIIVNRASSNFKHTLIWHFGDLQGTIIEKTVETTIGWTIPSSLYTQIPNAQIGIGVMECITYNGDTEIGRNFSDFYATTSENRCKPTLLATLVDTNQDTINLTGSNTKLIKYKSTAKITITTNAKNGASISSKKVNNSLVEGNSISISNVETDTFVVTVTDSRGYTKSVTLKPTVVNYIPLSINATVKRVQPTTGEVAIEFSGNYFNGNFGSTNNTLNINWYYREKNSSTWINGGILTTIINEKTYSNGNSKISLGTNFNYQKSYEFYLNVVDKLTTLQPNYSITQGIPIFNWGKDFFNVNGIFKINEINILELIFPIGSIYITQTNTNPSTILGFGTWERLKGKVCLGLDEEDTNMNEIGKTGGEKMHTLTIEEEPAHSHKVSYAGSDLIGNSVPYTENNAISYKQNNFYEDTNIAGGGQPHNNMQPFEIVGYMWIRRL
ncbi:MAG: hypothetical protein HFJ60_08930 [Clostridia bacterium]|nr:hypothetical protein [Clostridia bacterium]